MMLWKCRTQYVSKFGELSSGHRTGKGQFSFQSQRQSMTKNVQTTAQLHSISHASKVMLKILQARLQKYMNQALADVQAGFRKGRGIRDQIANIHWIIEKTRVLEKHPLLLHWLPQSLWLCGSQQTVEIHKEMGIPDHLIFLLRNLYAGKRHGFDLWVGKIPWRRKWHPFPVYLGLPWWLSQ